MRRTLTTGLSLHGSLAVAAACALMACRGPAAPTPRAPAEAAPPEVASAPAAVGARLLTVDTVSGSAAELVAARRAASAGEGRRLVVYVGAAWCEPCRHFHDAVARGALDEAFAGVDFLEFDLDRHGGPLEAAGYASRMIPLFAVPAADGQATPRRHAGAIKGPGAVAWLRPRLERLLRPR